MAGLVKFPPKTQTVVCAKKGMKMNTTMMKQMFGKVTTFVAAAMMAESAVAAWGTDVSEVEYAGVTYRVLTDGNKACIGTNTENVVEYETEAPHYGTTEKLSGVLVLPETLEVNSEEKAVTAVGSKAFNFYRDITGVVFPSGFTTLCNASFLHCDSLKAVWFKGKTSGSTTLTASGNGRGQRVFKDCDELKYVLVGPNVTATSTKNNLVGFITFDGLTFFLPDDTTWQTFASHNFSAGPAAGNNPNILFYGPGRELDIVGADGSGDGTITFTPATEHALTNVLAAASTFKAQFGLDSVVNITNRMDMTVAITEDMLQNVTLSAPPWYLTFQVNSQTQLDNVLAAVSADIPIVIELTGLDQQITVPPGRKVAILASENMTFRKKRNGLVITIR